MKYYQNKISGEIIGISNMRQVIKSPTDNSIKAGFKGYSYEVVYDMICPNHLIPNGVVSFCITYNYLTSNYKRIKKEIALSKYPNFKQYDYNNLIIESNDKKISKLDIIKSQSF